MLDGAAAVDDVVVSTVAGGSGSAVVAGWRGRVVVVEGAGLLPRPMVKEAVS